MTVPVSPYLSELIGSEEPTPCPICAATEHVAVYDGVALRGNVLRCVACVNCTHLFLNPRPRLDALKVWYSGDGYFHLCALSSQVDFETKMEQFDDDRFWADRAGYGRRLYEEYLTSVLSEQDTCFDFGCGDGGWLYGLREAAGCIVDGEEISDTYVEVVCNKLGIDLFHGPIEEVADDIVRKHRKGVKVAIVSGSLQHMVDPMACLRVAKEILVDDGYLYVCNWNPLDHYMTSYAGREPRRLLGEIFSWEHLHYFHESAYRYMVEVAGFEIEVFKAESTVRPRHMEVLARPRREGSAAPPAPPRSVDHVLAELRARESATIAERLPGSWLKR